MPCTAVAIAPT